MKRIEFLVPVLDQRGAGGVGVERREGYRVWLDLGGERVAFVLQLEDGRPRILAHWASGYRVGDIGPKMLERFVRHPAAYRETLHIWRREAQLFIDLACERKGLDTVRTMLASVPAINQE